MAPDNLKQLGRDLGKTKRDINHTTRYISKNLPLIEGTSDLFGAINTFRFEFETYGSGSVHLNLTIKPKFKQLRTKPHG